MIEIEFMKLIGTHEGTINVKRGGKTFKRTQRLGKRTSGREGTGKIDKLPDNVKQEIMNLRNLDYSGPEIKDAIETMIQNNADSETKKKLLESNVITEYGTATKLTVTPQGLVDWANKRGVGSSKKRKTVATVEREAEERWKSEWDKINAKNSKLEIELREVKDRLESDKKDAKNKRVVREKLRADLRACRAELKS